MTELALCGTYGLCPALDGCSFVFSWFFCFIIGLVFLFRLFGTRGAGHIARAAGCAATGAGGARRPAPRLRGARAALFLSATVAGGTEKIHVNASL